MKQQIKTGTVIALIVVGILLLLALLYKLLPLVILVLIALVFTTGIDPMVAWLQKVTGRFFKLPRALAILLVLLFFILIVLGIVSFLVVTAINEAAFFVNNTWPEIQDDVINWARGVSQRYAFVPPLDTLYDRLREQSGRIAGYLWSTTQAVFGVLGGIVSAVTVLILVFFFTNSKDGITHTFAQFIPPEHKDRVLEVTHRAGTKMGGWLRGQLMLALIVTVAILAAMYALGVPYATLLGIIGGLGELIPMLGPYVAAIPAILIVIFLEAPLWKIIAVIAFFLILSQTENYLLSPKIMEREVELSPITTILALLAGGSLLGIVGALLAIPIAAGGRIIFLELIFPAIQNVPRSKVEERITEPKES